jgi:HEAT repeat protein
VSADSLSSAPLDELIDRAFLSDPEAEEYWNAVGELQARGDRPTFEKARALALEPGEAERVLGVDILAQLGFKKGRPFLEESLPLVEGLASPDQTARMIEAAITALGHLADERSAPVVLAHVTHPDPDVRHAVAMALPDVSGDSPSRAVLEALFTLMADPDPDVRNWATFGLGAQFEVDTPEVRQALIARIEDDKEGGSIAGEALRGLARRRDERALMPILRRLAIRDPDPGYLILEAARELADARCLPALYALRDARVEQETDDDLTAAIDACERGPASL